jgi:hypothetical protein
LIFEPIEDVIDRAALIDGGMFSNLELDEGILKCREQGFDDKDIIVDIILCHDKNLVIDKWTKQEYKYKNAYDMYQRK